MNLATKYFITGVGNGINKKKARPSCTQQTEKNPVTSLPVHCASDHTVRNVYDLPLHKNVHPLLHIDKQIWKSDKVRRPADVAENTLEEGVLGCPWCNAQDRGDQSLRNILHRNDLRIARYRANTRRKNISDDVRASDGYCLFPGRSYLRIHLQTEKRITQQHHRSEHSMVAECRLCDLGRLFRYDLDAYRFEFHLPLGRIQERS